MGGFLNRLSKTLDQGAKQLEQGAAKAQFEGDKLIRAQRAKGEADALRGQMDKSVMQLGQQVLALIHTNELDHPALRSIADQIKSIEGQIAAKEAQVQSIQAEQFHLPASASTAPGSPAPQPASSAPSTSVPGTPMASSIPEIHNPNPSGQMTSSIPEIHNPAAALPPNPQPNVNPSMGTTTGTTGSSGTPDEHQGSHENPGAGPLSL